MTLEIMRHRKQLRLGVLQVGHDALPDKNILQVLEFATTRSPEACQALLKAQGLKTVFAFFMQKMKVTVKPVMHSPLVLKVDWMFQDPEAEQKGEETALTIISNLMMGLNFGSGFERIAAKFVENEFEKCDRLLELYFMSFLHSFLPNINLFVF